MLLLLSCVFANKSTFLFPLYRFESYDQHHNVGVRVIDDKGLSSVQFYSSPKLEKETFLCKLNIRLSPLKKYSKVRLNYRMHKNFPHAQLSAFALYILKNKWSPFDVFVSCLNRLKYGHIPLYSFFYAYNELSRKSIQSY